MAVSLGSDGNVKINNSAGAVDVIADVVGYYVNDGVIPTVTGTDHTYTYNGDGARMTKTTAGTTTTFAWDSADQLLTETTNGATTTSTLSTTSPRNRSYSESCQRYRRGGS